MNRRTMLTALATGSAGLVSALSCGGASNLAALDPWNAQTKGDDDVRLHAAALGLLAPNPHNKQPWLVRLVGSDTLELYVDPSRTIPKADPFFRQIYIAQGAFVELLVMAATQMGYRADVAYFPSGEPSQTALDSNPVASVRFNRDAAMAPDPLATSIPLRHSNKRRYDRSSPPTDDELRAIQDSCKASGCSIRLATRGSLTKEIGQLVVDAVRIEDSDVARHEEMVEMFRFSDAEIERLRDGFGLEQNGTSGSKRWLAEKLFLSREDARKVDGDFVKQTLELTRVQVESTTVWGALVTESNRRIDQVMAGRAYARTSLTAATRSVAQHPMSSILEEYDAMRAHRRGLAERLGLKPEHTVQMLFRLGHASPVRHTPRRDLKSLLIWKPSSPT